jgi:AbrB family looped-hinge helix DNA binding protein
MKKEGTILGLVTVNEKGQVVIPAAARSATSIEPGDKLFVMIHPSHEGVYLVKPDGLETYARKMLEKVQDFKNLIEEDEQSGK